MKDKANGIGCLTARNGLGNGQNIPEKGFGGSFGKVMGMEKIIRGQEIGNQISVAIHPYFSPWIFLIRIVVMMFSLVKQIGISGRRMKNPFRSFYGSASCDNIFHAEYGRMVSDDMIGSVTIRYSCQFHFKRAGRKFGWCKLIDFFSHAHIPHFFA